LRRGANLNRFAAASSNHRAVLAKGALQSEDPDFYFCLFSSHLFSVLSSSLYMWSGFLVLISDRAHVGKVVFFAVVRRRRRVVVVKARFNALYSWIRVSLVLSISRKLFCVSRAFIGKKKWRRRRRHTAYHTCEKGKKKGDVAHDGYIRDLSPLVPRTFSGSTQTKERKKNTKTLRSRSVSPALFFKKQFSKKHIASRFFNIFSSLWCTDSRAISTTNVSLSSRALLSLLLPVILILIASSHVELISTHATTKTSAKEH